MNSLTDKATLREIQLHLDEMCKEKGWDKNSISEVFLLLTEEVGELAKAVRKQTGFKGEAIANNTDNLKEELADVFNYILEIANRFDINLEQAYRDKHEINKTRVWK